MTVVFGLVVRPVISIIGNRYQFIVAVMKEIWLGQALEQNGEILNSSKHSRGEDKQQLNLTTYPQAGSLVRHPHREYHTATIGRLVILFQSLWYLNAVTTMAIAHY